MSNEDKPWEWLSTSRLRSMALLIGDSPVEFEREDRHWIASFEESRWGLRQRSRVSDAEKAELDKHLAGELAHPSTPAETAPQPVFGPPRPPQLQLSHWLAGVTGKATGLRIYADEAGQSGSFELQGVEDDLQAPDLQLFDTESVSASRWEAYGVRLSFLLGEEPVLSLLRKVARDPKAFDVLLVDRFGTPRWSFGLR